jgi:AcrR family transcriptional regulator
VPTRPEADGRRLRGQRNRARVVAAAGAMFEARGYVATTIEDVARAAGVAPQTVYHAFGSKPVLLAAVLDARIVGDDAPVAVAERPWVESVAAARSGAAAVAVLAAGATAILARVAPLWDVVRSASADPEVAALLAANRRARGDDQRRLAELLAARGLLRDGVDVDAAADVLYALVSEDVFLLLTVDRGWPVERFERWLAESLRRQLVGR